MKEIKVERTASRGIVIAPVYRYGEGDLTPEKYKISVEQQALEKEKFHMARTVVLADLKKLAAVNDVFSAHLEMAGDFTLAERVYHNIEENQNVQMAVAGAIRDVAAVFDAMEDGYLKERGDDIRDLGKRFLAALKGVTLPDLGCLDREVIVVARDLYPSDTVKLNADFVKGIITEEGGLTSHVSIFAKNMNIPILVGVKGIQDEVKEGCIVCMDARAGQIVVDPDEDTRTEYSKKREAEERHLKALAAVRRAIPITREGKRIRLCANVGSVREIRRGLEMNIDGVGLFRSERLYMEGKHLPTEEEQFHVYREAALLVPEELTVRTLDIGGDKPLSQFNMEKEENPFLGWRAIRICLEHQNMFKQQLRAILRASAYGHVRILFPMIVSLEEFREAKKLTEICKAEFQKEKIPFDGNIELGIMMETPSSVLLADEFAKEADFFSIGTNDLTQYLLAVDRGNKKVAGLYDPFHPAVQKAIRLITEAGHRQHIPVGICGELAGDPKALPGLLSAGLDELSMSPSCLDEIRSRILIYP